MPIFAAYADGKSVQCRRRGTVHWWEIVSPHDFSSYDEDDYEYQVKPEPEPREWWAVEYPDGSIGILWNTAKEANDRAPANGNRRVIHVREVLP
jgi:hypothetical protein